jgi:hypothetical protein
MIPHGADIGVYVRGSLVGFSVGQDVGTRDSAVRAALGLFEKADCDRLGNRIACG